MGAEDAGWHIISKTGMGDTMTAKGSSTKSPADLLKKRDVPQFIVVNFAAQVIVEVKNTVDAEDLAREKVIRNPELLKMESMYRKQPTKKQRRS